MSNNYRLKLRNSSLGHGYVKLAHAGAVHSFSQSSAAEASTLSASELDDFFEENMAYLFEVEDCARFEHVSARSLMLGDKVQLFDGEYSTGTVVRASKPIGQLAGVIAIRRPCVTQSEHLWSVHIEELEYTTDLKATFKRYIG